MTSLRSIGGYVELAARLDLICVVSSCPYDLALPDWEINVGAAGGPTELLVEIDEQAGPRRSASLYSRSQFPAGRER